MSQPLRGLVAVGAILLVAVIVWVGCGSNMPQLIFGPSVTGNQPPVLQILEPNASTSINQGERLLIRWTDSDPDSAALISFFFVGVDSSVVIPLVTNIPENDNAAPDFISVSTALVPIGSYQLRAEINDLINAPVSTFAFIEGTTSTRAVIQVSPPGSSPLSVPPQVAVVEPSFNQSVSQDDTLTVIARPNRDLFDDTTPFDPDSDATLFILLDLDEDPTNDSAQAPDPTRIIVLRQRDIVAGSGGEQRFDIPVDLAQIPARPNGAPYFIRATIVDPGNPPVHAYAPGSINVVRSATGVVDVTQAGLSLAGARFQGFNPGSRLGTTMVGIGDFDADGIDDFILVAERGNPRNFGNIGEAYLMYGLPQGRFGGTNNVNSVSTTISGVIFEAPPNRLEHLHPQEISKPRGITSVAAVQDLTGDGRPDLLFGLGLVNGIYQGRDDDPGDNPGDVIAVFTAKQEAQSLTLNNIPDPTLDDDYQGTVDTYIDRDQPNTQFGNSTALRFSAGGDDDVIQAPIIGFQLPTILAIADPDNIELDTVTITLFLDELAPITDETFSIHRLLGTPSDTETYSSFGFDGVPGPTEETEYDTEELEYSINFFGVPQIEIDVTDTVQAILDGEIATLTPTWIILPQTLTAGSFFSSEAADDFRPTLTANFTIDAEELFVENVSCYPDDLPNNISTGVPQPPATRPPHDSISEGCGVAIFFASENRDNDGPINPDRLEATQVALELVGQTPPPLGLPPTDFRVEAPPTGVFQPTGDIDTFAAPLDQATTRGARMQSGWYDFINDSEFANRG